MRATAARWARSAIAGLREVVHAGRADAWRPLGQLALRAGDVGEHPVGERPARRVGVVDDQCEALRLRRAIPAQWRGAVLAVAGVLYRYRLAIGEGGAAERKVHGCTSCLRGLTRRCSPASREECERGQVDDMLEI